MLFIFPHLPQTVAGLRRHWAIGRSYTIRGNSCGSFHISPTCFAMGQTKRPGPSRAVNEAPPERCPLSDGKRKVLERQKCGCKASACVAQSAAEKCAIW